MGMHEGLQKIMSIFMFNDIFNEWWGHYIIIRKFYWDENMIIYIYIYKQQNIGFSK
jgi:hypothetical protein